MLIVTLQIIKELVSVDLNILVIHLFNVIQFQVRFFRSFQYSVCSVSSDFHTVHTPVEIARPCDPSPCGANAVCKERSGAGSCSCISEYYGDPYSGCRPECTSNSECDNSKACINQKCKDPCPGACGNYAQCFVVNHRPTCECFNGYTGNPSTGCREIPRSNFFFNYGERCSFAFLFFLKMIIFRPLIPAILHLVVLTVLVRRWTDMRFVHV
jgi:hypothetical protein